MFYTHLATFVLLALLFTISVIDLRTLRIPDVLNALLALAGLGAAWVLNRSVPDSLIGVAAGYGAMWALSAAYRALRGRDGLGMGDAKLLAGAGAWVGWMGLPFVVLIASALGVAYAAARRLAGRETAATDALAFGPFLSIGVFAVWLVLAYAQL
ncbi:MAG: A24 family peptidase [Hyphomonadaceae bacterium]|nr:A24 family peptidase [Hyphomonadaceae bacterium]